MKRLKELRNKMRITQQDIADALSIERITYARYESGARSPSLEMLAKLADYFDVSVDFLLERVNNPNPYEAIETPDNFPLITDIAARSTNGQEPITRDQVIEIVQEVLGDFRREQQRMKEIKKKQDR